MLPPWLRSHLYKVVVVVVLALIALQYSFSVIFESRRLEPLFAINSSLLRLHRPASLRSKGLLFNETAYNHSLPRHSPVNDTSAHNASRPLASDPAEPPTPTGPNATVAVAGKPMCPPVPPNLEGPIKVQTEAPSLEELAKRFPWLEAGGRHRPPDCVARDRVAIVVSYRDRQSHLAVFLANLHPLLRRQQLDYGIFVIEQAGDGPFNRAMLLNVGFVEASKLYGYDCFVFHDVDLLPEDDRNIYSCPEQPRHMSVAVDTFRYRLPYKGIFGGVSALTREQFSRVNGFSNVFWGWGGEDDDMSNRIRYHGYHISRYPFNVARYKMLSHRKERANPKRYQYLNTGQKRFKTDGLNSLRYRRREIRLEKLFTWVLVELEVPS